MSQEPESFSPCPECGGERVAVRPVATMQAVNNVRLVYPENANFITGLSLDTRALACTFCGYTALYAKRPEDLAQTVQNRREQTKYFARQVARRAESRSRDQE